MIKLYTKGMQLRDKTTLLKDQLRIIKKINTRGS